MPVFRIKSIDEAIAKWVKRDPKTVRNKAMFWDALAHQTVGYKADTLRKYIAGSHDFSPEKFDSIQKSALSLGVSSKSVGKASARNILDPEFLNLSIALELSNADKNQPRPNRIEPDKNH